MKIREKRSYLVHCYCRPSLAHFVQCSRKLKRNVKNRGNRLSVILWHYVHFLRFLLSFYLSRPFSLISISYHRSPKQKQQQILAEIFCLSFYAHLLYDLSLNIYLRIFTKLVNYLILSTAKLTFSNVRLCKYENKQGAKRNGEERKRGTNTKRRGKREPFIKLLLTERLLAEFIVSWKLLRAV